MISTPRLIRLALTLFLGASFAACGGDDSSGPGSGNGTITPPAANEVNVGDFFFNPSSRTTSSGTTVTWTWIGAVAHNVTFNDGVGNSITQSSGTHTRQFAAAGTFPYHCTIHGATVMSGEIVVQ